MVIPTLSMRQRVVMRELATDGAFILEIYNADKNNTDVSEDSVSIRHESDEHNVTAMVFGTFDSFVRKGLIEKLNPKPMHVGGKFYSNKYVLSELGKLVVSRFGSKQSVKVEKEGE